MLVKEAARHGYRGHLQLDPDSSNPGGIVTSIQSPVGHKEVANVRGGSNAVSAFPGDREHRSCRGCLQFSRVKRLTPRHDRRTRQVPSKLGSLWAQSIITPENRRKRKVSSDPEKPPSTTGDVKESSSTSHIYYFFYGTIADDEALQKSLSLPSTRKALLGGVEKVRWGTEWTLLPASSTSSELVYANKSSPISSRPVLEGTTLEEATTVEGVVCKIPATEECRLLGRYSGTKWKPITVDNITILSHRTKRGKEKVKETVEGKTLVYAGDTTSVLEAELEKLHLKAEDTKKLAARIQGMAGMAEMVRGYGDPDAESPAAYGSTQPRTERGRRTGTMEENKPGREERGSTANAPGKGRSRRKTFPTWRVVPPLHTHPAFRPRRHTDQGYMAETITGPVCSSVHQAAPTLHIAINPELNATSEATFPQTTATWNNNGSVVGLGSEKRQSDTMKPLPHVPEGSEVGALAVDAPSPIRGWPLREDPRSKVREDP